MYGRSGDLLYPTNTIQQTHPKMLLSQGSQHCIYSTSRRLRKPKMHMQVSAYDRFKGKCSCYCYLKNLKNKGRSDQTLTIPRLELCGALLLGCTVTRLRHTKELLHIPTSDVHAWTIVLSWLIGSFKTFVGNRVASTVDLIPPERWRHEQTVMSGLSY